MFALFRFFPTLKTPTKTYFLSQGKRSLRIMSQKLCNWALVPCWDAVLLNDENHRHGNKKEEVTDAPNHLDESQRNYDE